MRKGIIGMAAFALAAACPAVGHADAVTDCAKAQGKAYAAFLASVLTEAGRACGKGSTGAPTAISEGAIGKAAGKFYAVVGKSVDQFGPASCAFTLATLDGPQPRADINTTIDTAINAAKIACLVPVGP
jgi:hypothetical protein